MSWGEAGDKFKNPWKKQRNRLPAISVSAMENFTQGFNFVVSMNAFTFGFTEVSDIRIEKPFETIKEGGVNDHPLIVGKPDDNEKTLTFKRGLILRSPSLISAAAKAAAASIPNNIARRAALVAINALDPQESLESGPSLGVIQVFDRGGKLTALYNFVSLGLRSWSHRDLDANDSNILIEEITIIHTGLTRMPVTITPALFAATSSNEQGSAWDADAASERWKQAEENKKREKETQAEILKESKDRKKESEKGKLDAEKQKMLDDAKRILGDEFEKFAGNLQALLNGAGSIEEKLKKLEEEKSKLKDEINEYYSTKIEERVNAEKERIDKIEKEKAEKANEIIEQKRPEEQEKDINDENYVSEEQKEKREEIDKKNQQCKAEAEQRAAEAREKAERRKEELEKIRAEQAVNRDKAEDAKNKARKDYIDSRNAEQTRMAEEKAAKEREEEIKRKEQVEEERRKQLDKKIEEKTAENVEQENNSEEEENK